MATSLLDWIADLLRDSDARESFFDHPDRYANDHGFSNLSPADVRDSLHLLAEDGFPSPKHFNHGDHQDGAHYLRSYFHENRAFIDNRDTDLDNRIHQDIDTGGRGRDHDGDHDFNRGFDRHGGDFTQHIDNDPVVASGDHAVAAGGDIQNSFITSGRGNVVGDHDDAATGSGNTTAFGDGDEHHRRIARIAKRHDIQPVNLPQRRQAQGGVGQTWTVKQLVQENVIADQNR